MAEQDKNKNLEALHEQLVKDRYAVPKDFKQFEYTFKDIKNARLLFEQLTEDKYAVPADFDSFATTFGLKKKDASDYGMPTGQVFQDMLKGVSEKYEVSEKPEEFKTPTEGIGTEQTPEIDTPESPEEIQKKKGSYVGDLLERIGAGAIDIATSGPKQLKFAERIMDVPRDIVKKELSLLGIKEDKAEQISQYIPFLKPAVIGDAVKVSSNIWDKIEKTEPFQNLEKKAEELRESSARYDETISELVKNKEYKKAIGASFLSAAESFPLTVTAMFGGPVGLAAIGSYSAGAQYDEIASTDMTETSKIANALLNGGLEIATERLGTANYGGLIKSLYKEAGKEIAEDAVKKGLKSWFVNMFKKFGIYTAPVGEGIEEAVNQMGSNITARITGEDANRPLLANVFDAAASGVASGTVFTSVGAPAQIMQQKASKAEAQQKQAITDKGGVVTEVGELKVPDEVREQYEAEKKAEEVKTEVDEVGSVKEEPIVEEIAKTPEETKAEELKQKADVLKEEVKQEGEVIDIDEESQQVISGKKPVFHGTFKDFEEFDPEMRGVNTGAPSAKEGFFFASNPKVADSYASDVTLKLKGLEKQASKARDELKTLTGDTEFTAGQKLFRKEYDEATAKKVQNYIDRINAYDDYVAGLQDMPMAYSSELARSGKRKEVYLDMKNPLVKDFGGSDARDVSYSEVIKEAKAKGHDGVIFKNTYDGGDPVGNLEKTDVYVVFDKSQIKEVVETPEVKEQTKETGEAYNTPEGKSYESLNGDERVEEGRRLAESTRGVKDEAVIDEALARVRRLKELAKPDVAKEQVKAETPVVEAPPAKEAVVETPPAEQKKVVAETKKKVEQKLDKQKSIKDDKIFKEQKRQLLDDLIQAEDILLGKNKDFVRENEDDYMADLKDSIITSQYEYKLDELPPDVEKKLNKLGIKVKDGKLLVDIYKDGSVEVGDIRTALRIIDKGFPARLKERRFTESMSKPGARKMRDIAESYGSLEEAQRRVKMAEDNLAEAKKGGVKGLERVMGEQLDEAKAILKEAEKVDFTRIAKEREIEADKEFGEFYAKEGENFGYYGLYRDKLFDIIKEEGRPEKLTYDTVMPLVMRNQLREEKMTAEQKINQLTDEKQRIESELQRNMGRKDGKGLRQPKNKGEEWSLRNANNRMERIDHEVADLTKYGEEITKQAPKEKEQVQLEKEVPDTDIEKAFESPNKESVNQLVEDKVLPKAYWNQGDDIDILAVKEINGIDPRTGEKSKQRNVYYQRKENNLWETVLDIWYGENRQDRVIIDRKGSKEALRMPNETNFYNAEHKFGEALRRGLETDAVSEFQKEEFALRNALSDVQKKAQEDYEAELKKAKIFKLAQEGKAPTDKTDALKAKVKEKWADELKKAKKALDDFREGQDKYIEGKVREKLNLKKADEKQVKESPDRADVKDREAGAPVVQRGTGEAKTAVTREGKEESKGDELVSKYVAEISEKQLEDALAEGKKRGQTYSAEEIEKAKARSLEMNTKTFNKLKDEIDAKDFKALQDRYFYNNKTWKKFFEEYTGVKLGDKLKDINDALREFTGQKEAVKPETQKMSKEESMNKAQQARINKVLDTRIRYDDGIMTRREHIDKVIGEGGKTEMIEVDNEKARQDAFEAIKYIRTNGLQNVRAKELAEAIATKENPPKIKKYRLYYKDGRTFIDIGKVEYDYAKGKEDARGTEKVAEAKSEVRPEDKPYADYFDKIKKAVEGKTDAFDRNRIIDDMVYALAGDAKKGFRQRFLSYLKGEKVPVAKSGIRAIKEELNKRLGEVKETKIPAETTPEVTPLRQEAERILAEETKGRQLSEITDLINKSNDIDGLKSLLDMDYVKKDMDLPKEINSRIQYLQRHPEKEVGAVKTYDEFLKDKRERWKETFEATDEEFAESFMESDLKKEWRDQVREASNNKNQLSGEVLESFAEVFGREDYLSTFRGVREQEYTLKQEAPSSKKITTTDDGVKYKGKTYTEIEQVQDDFADKKLTFDEQRDLMEQVRRYENKKMGIEPGTDKPEELAWDEPLPISTNEDPNYKHSDLNNAMAIRNVSSNMIRNMGLGEGTDFRVGFITRFARKARGLFNPRSGIIRAKGKRDFRVVAHEIGHWLDFEIFDIRGIISTMATNKQLGPGIDYNGKIYTDVKQVEADMKDRVLTISEGNELLLKVRKFEALKLKEKYSEVVEQTRAVGVKYKSKTYKSVRDINNAVKAGVMTQDMGNKKIAEFNTKNKGRDVRIQAMNDKYGTDVVAGIMQRNTFKQELDGLLTDIRYPMKQRKRTEAIAEFVYNYIVDPKQVIDSTPNFLAWFEKMLDNAPPIKKALHQAREDWAKYDAQDIRTKLEAEQKAPEKERTRFLEGIVNIAGEMYYSMVNQLAPIKGVVDEWRKIVGEEVYQPFKDAHLSAKAMLGIDGRAMQWLLHNPYFNRGNNVVFRKDVKGLLKIVKPIIDTPNYESYKTYLLALDSIESHMREKPEQAYYGLEEARKAKALYEEEFGARKLMEFQDDVRKYNEALLDFYVESGRISKETADYWKTEHQFYVPLRRIAEVYETHRGRQKVTRDMLPESERAIFSRKGSQKQVKDIFESMLENTYHILHSGEQNLLNRNIIDMLKDIHDYNRKNRMGAILDEIDPRDVVAYRDPSTGEIRYSLAKERPSNFRKPQGRIVVVYENGKPRFYDVAPEYYDNIFKVVGPQTASMNKIIKVLSLPSRWLQAGAVVYDPTFPIRNIFRDQMSAFFYSKHSYHPGWFIKGITSTIGKDEYYHKWLASGADQSFLVSADKMMSEDYMSKKIGDMTQRKFKAYGKNPLLALQDFSILSEMGTRIGAFQNAYKKTGNVRLAMEESRDIAADYGIKGASMKNILPFYPFLNARTQHARMTIQSMKKAPVEFLLKGIAGVTIPSLLNWLRNNLDDDDRDLYQSLPTWRRVGMFNIRIPFTDHFMPIPKGFFGVMFGSSIESALDALVGDDPRVAKELASQIYEEISPVGNWSEVIPLIARPAIEDAVNQKGYTGKPIVSESMKMLEKPQQFYTSTPEIIKKIGEGLNWSPVRIEHYVRSYTGGAGIGAVNILDETLQLIGIVEKKPEDTFTALSRLPMLKAVLTEKPIGLYSGYVSEFYETLDKIEKVNFTFNNYIKNDDADAAEKFLENKENKKMYSFYLGNSTAVNAFRQSLTWVRDAGYAVMKDDLLTGKEKQEEISRMNNIVQETVLRFKKAYDNNEWFDYGKEMDDIIKQMKADKKEGTAKLTAEKNVYNPYWQQARLKDKETFDLLREFGGLREIEQTRSYSRYGEKIELMPEDARAFNEELISDFIKRVDYNLGKKREQWLEYQQETDSNDPLKTRLESLLDEQWSFALKATKETFTPSENK